MPLLRTEKKDQILFIHFSDSKSQNAFSPSMAKEFLSVIENETYQGLIVSHDHNFFCSGGNLKFYQGLSSKKEGLKVNQEITSILDKLNDLPVPKACFVNGPCLGGGIELLSTFDFVVASPKALFGLWQRRIGLTFGWGGQKRLLQRLKKRDLQNWLLGAQTLGVYRAEELGLVDLVALTNQGLKECEKWINSCLCLGTESLECILGKRENQEAVFSELWHGEKHMNVLKKFK